jgi:hypothetical protein
LEARGIAALVFCQRYGSKLAASPQFGAAIHPLADVTFDLAFQVELHFRIHAVLTAPG